VATEYGLDGGPLSYVAAFLTIATGLLMVSNFRYYSFKDIDLRGKVPFVVAIAVMLCFGLIFAHPPVMLFGLFFLYALSGPVVTLILRRKRRSKRSSV
jgi:CDP-diacylglycerol--serine O-phosphatidyltransferase